VIVGKNAQGKTSILEALSLLTQLRSFKTRDNSELILMGKNQASISAEIVKPTYNQVVIGLESKKRTCIRIGEKKISSKADYDFLGSSVSFIPDDLYLVKGGPENRRDFMNQLAMNLDPQSVVNYQQFQKSLKQRNNLLKQFKEMRGNEEQLQLWNEKYIESAVKIYEQRHQLVQDLREFLPQVYLELFSVSESIDFQYDHGFDSDCPSKEEIYQKIQRLSQAEKAVGYSLCGPHRDDFCFSLEKKKARHFASQGQTRSLVLL